LLYVRENALLAQALDGRTFAPEGDPVRLTSPAGFYGNILRASFSTSPSGLLAFSRQGTARSQLTWLDRTGRQVGTAGGVQDYSGLALAPNDSLVALRRGEERGTTSLWIMDLTRGVTNKLADYGITAAWTRDDLIYIDLAKGQWLRKRLNTTGEGQPIMQSARAGGISVSSDGKLAVSLGFLYRLEHPNEKPIPLKGGAERCSFSPDDRWMACEGRGDIFVLSVPDGDQRYDISSGDGFSVQWSRSGTEIFYRSRAGNTLMTVAVKQTGRGLAFGMPSPLFKMPLIATSAMYAPSSDGKRFLTLLPANDGTANEPIRLLTNWRASLKGK
jgi:hypothetical protein